MFSVYQQGSYNIALGVQTVTIPFGAAFPQKPAAVFPVVANEGPMMSGGEPKYLITAMLGAWDANGFTVELSTATNRADYKIDWIAGDFSAVYAVTAQVRKFTSLARRSSPVKPTDLILVVDQQGVPKTEAMTAATFLQNTLGLTLPPTNPGAPGSNNLVAIDDTYFHTYFNGAWKSARRDATAGGGGASLPPWKLLTTNSNALAFDRILADTSSGSFAVTLPSEPAVGQEVVFADYAGTWDTNNLTVSRNGNLIDGLSENLICDVNVTFRLVFIGNTTGWKSFTF